MNRPIARILIQAVLAALAVGCSSGKEGRTLAEADDPSDQLALWQGGKPDAYAYTLSRSCFCLLSYVGPFLVEAEGDSVTRVRRIEGDDTLQVDVDLQAYSIQALFETVAEMIKERNFREEVAYHPEYGFPVSASFDGSANVADDELELSVTDFRTQ